MFNIRKFNIRALILLIMFNFSAYSMQPSSSQPATVYITPAPAPSRSLTRLGNTVSLGTLASAAGWTAVAIGGIKATKMLQKLFGKDEELQKKLTEYYTSHQADILRVEGKIDKVAGQVQATRTDLGRVESKVSAAALQIDGAREDLSRLETQVGGVSSRVDTVHGGVTRLEREVQSVRDLVNSGMGELTGQVGVVREDIASTRTWLRDQTAAMSAEQLRYIEESNAKLRDAIALESASTQAHCTDEISAMGLKQIIYHAHNQAFFYLAQMPEDVQQTFKEKFITPLLSSPAPTQEQINKLFHEMIQEVAKNNIIERNLTTQERNQIGELQAQVTSMSHKIDTLTQIVTQYTRNSGTHSHPLPGNEYSHSLVSAHRIVTPGRRASTPAALSASYRQPMRSYSTGISPLWDRNYFLSQDHFNIRRSSYSQEGFGGRLPVQLQLTYQPSTPVSAAAREVRESKDQA